MARMNKKQLQIIAQLERRVAMCQEFMNDWLLFNQIMSAYPSPGVNKAQLENQFLKIKSKLAREHRVLKDTLAADYNLDAGTMNLVSQSTSLDSIYAQSDVAIKKLQTEWHRCFISINETLGALVDKKQRAEAGEKIYLVTGAGLEGGGPKGSSADVQTALWVIGAIVLVAAAAAGAYFSGLVQWWLDSFNN